MDSNSNIRNRDGYRLLPLIPIPATPFSPWNMITTPWNLIPKIIEDVKTLYRG